MGANSGFHIRDKVLFATTVAIVALSTISYYLFQAPTDPYRCKALLNEGFWLNPSALTNWQPAGCMLHTYKAAEASHCLQDRRVVFIGGTSTRYLFEGVAAKFDNAWKPTSWGRESNQQADLLGVRFEFVWDPYLKSKELSTVQKGFENERDRPALTVIGIGHDYMRHEKDISRYSAQVGSVISQFGSGLSGRAKQSDSIVFSPVLLPEPDKLTDSDKLAITTKEVMKMNDVLLDMAREYKVDVAFAFNEVVRGAPNALVDGLNPVPKASAVMADILLNLRCNTQLPKHYPYASTCCNEYPKPSWVQIAFFVFICGFIPIAYYLHSRGLTPDSSSFMRMMPAPKYLGSILVMGLTVVLCYYCDRTNIFGKEQKQTSPSQFFIGMGILIAGSLFTLHKADKDLPFLNRDQTDEWKGWMQVAILVYHYVGVSKTEYIYNYMRVCPTSYLFMTGFGHTVYFLKKDDYSFKRVVATMLRLNLLNVILAYVMGNDWLLYYFAPLVTWNFFVIWTLLWAGHQYNKNMKFLFGKMIVFALVNTAFNRVPGVLEGAWAMLQALFNMQGDLREWRFRVTLDQYSVFPGMIAAVFFINWNNYSLPKSHHWPMIHRIICTGSAGIMLWYAYFEVSQPSKIIYNTKHTYVRWLPCCAFVILRNATPWLRKTHNGFFAWVGRGSLETFLLQFHIWLGADTAGLLTFAFPYQRAINAIIATVVFLYVASLTTSATGTVIEWVMAAESKPQRPTLPTMRSHPAHLPNGAQNEKAPNVAIPEANGTINSAVPINAAPTDIKVQDPEKLEKDFAQGSASRRRGLLSTAATDLRVRVGIILTAMAVMNWTYNW